MDMLVYLLMDTRVCMETQKVTGYWGLVMQQIMVVANIFSNRRDKTSDIPIMQLNQSAWLSGKMVKDVKLWGKNVAHSTNL